MLKNTRLRINQTWVLFSTEEGNRTSGVIVNFKNLLHGVCILLFIRNS